MRGIIVNILLLFVLISCNEPVEQRVPVVDGVIQNSISKTLYLYKQDKELILLDTILINDQGGFRIYQESIDTIGFYLLKFDNGNEVNMFLKHNDFIQLHAEYPDITNTCESKNSKAMNAFWNIERNTKQFQKEIENIDNAFKNLIGAEDVDSLYNELLHRKDSIKNIYKSKSLDIVKGVKNEVVTWLMLNQKAGNVSLFSLDKDLKLFLENDEDLTRNKDLKPFFAQYDEDLMKVYSLIRTSERFSEGENWISLKARTNWNDSLPLQKLNAKLVHVVLWDANLNQKQSNRINVVSAVQKKYGGRGLKTLMVAYQRDKNLWKDNINKLNNSYWHLIDTSGIESTDLMELGVRYFPLNFLVDRDGKIVARDLWDQELDKRVSSFLKNY